MDQNGTSGKKVRAQPVWHLLAYQPTAIDPNKIASIEMPKISKFDPLKMGWGRSQQLIDSATKRG